MAVKICREDTSEFKVTVVEPVQAHEPTIYDLAFLHIELKWIREYGLNELELLVFAFINSYKPSSGKIYFSNAQLGKMFNKSEQTISRCIGSLKEKGIVQVELQTGIYGGTIRYLVPKIQQNSDYSKMTRGVVKNEEGGSQKRLPNSNRNSNIKYISKDMEKTPLSGEISSKTNYGNEDINKFIKGVNKYLEIKLPDDGKARQVARNALELFTKTNSKGGIKEGRGFLKEDKWENVKDFLAYYLETKVDRGYSAQSWFRLYDNIKLWIANEGKVPTK